MTEPTTLYTLLGGAEGLAALVGRFYHLMDTNPRYAALRAVHGETLDYAEERLFEFLSGWTGGPPLYETRHGHPRLRRRHFPFAVTVKTRNQWIACFAEALRSTPLARDAAGAVLLHLFVLADWMRNQNEPKYAPPQPPVAGSMHDRLPELAEVLAEYGMADVFEAV
ncbi:group II truncated hemoglobin [Neisseria leonii]|uniref:group II truncated hemoglobin n=1 Tax=Neisseria leonii TaxID=2995413 RepID=UPI00237A22AB|nr:group II truncated hemoglobin [Neisseria sp. 3986]MDD9326572.1 group II truncated hemoglobin [Neisseria sp. 3986]